MPFTLVQAGKHVTENKLKTDITKIKQLDWIVQCFTSPPTQYRLYGRRFLQVKRPNQQYQSTEGDATKEKAIKNENNYITHTYTSKAGTAKVEACTEEVEAGTGRAGRAVGAPSGPEDDAFLFGPA